MENRNTTITLKPRFAEAYNAAPKKVQEQAQNALYQVLREAAAPVRQPARLSKTETALFRKINRVLPQAQQSRYDELKRKRDQETLTEAEHAELLLLVEVVQNLWAERLGAVLKLAKLRNLAPSAMFKQLGIDPGRYA